MADWLSRRSPVGTLAALLACLLYLVVTALAAAQSKSSASSPAVDWEQLTPEIETALGSPYAQCVEERRWVEVLASDDLGNRVVTAIVAYCHMGAYTSDTTVIQLEHGKPVLASFRDTRGRPVHPEMLTGASVRNGTDVKFIPAKHALFQMCWHTDDSAKMDSCGGTAYVWNPATRTLDEDERVSREVSQAECKRLGQELERMNGPAIPKQGP
jgi:hypothetical protein